MVKENNSLSFKKLMLSPWVILLSIVIGALIGLFQKEWIPYLDPIGRVYLALLQMCILPILIAAIVSSLAGILKSGDAAGKLKTIFVIYTLGLFFAGVVGVAIGYTSQMGHDITPQTKQLLGELLVSENHGKASSDNQTEVSALGFFEDMVPSNIFFALSQGNNLGVLFFSILLGVSLGLGRDQTEHSALAVTNAIYNSLIRMINGIIYGLPLGLICIFSKQISIIGVDIFFALGRFVFVSVVICLFVVLSYLLIMAFLLDRSPWSVFRGLKEPFFVALGTQSSFATIPSAIQALEDNFSLDSHITNLMMPLGICLNPQGSVLLFSVAAIFIAGLYDMTLGIDGLLIVYFGSILAGIAATGAPGVGALAMISIVLNPLGLPLETAIVILVAVAPIVDPFFTVANVFGNCTATTIVSRGPEKFLKRMSRQT